MYVAIIYIAWLAEVVLFVHVIYLKYYYYYYGLWMYSNNVSIDGILFVCLYIIVAVVFFTRYLVWFLLHVYCCCLLLCCLLLCCRGFSFTLRWRQWPACGVKKMQLEWCPLSCQPWDRVVDPYLLFDWHISIYCIIMSCHFIRFINFVE